MAGSGRIRVGVGGWVYEPWRGVFYPEDISQKKEPPFAVNPGIDPRAANGLKR